MVGVLTGSGPGAALNVKDTGKFLYPRSGCWNVLVGDGGAIICLTLEAIRVMVGMPR